MRSAMCARKRGSDVTRAPPRAALAHTVCLPCVVVGAVPRRPAGQFCGGRYSRASDAAARGLHARASDAVPCAGRFAIWLLERKRGAFLQCVRVSSS